jgi:NADH-quinone oxidoreductase subunit M
MSQRDIKRLISYSSISHLGFIMLGAVALTQQSVQGAVWIMVNHGITTSALFLLVGIVQDQGGSTALEDIGGLARSMPLFSAIMTLTVLSTIGLPGTNGFVGEFLVLLGTYAENPTLVIIASTGVIVAAIYGLRAVQAMLFAPASGARPVVVDLNLRERAVLGVLAIAMIWLGLAPSPVLLRVERASRAVVEAARFSPNATITRSNLSTRIP